MRMAYGTQTNTLSRLGSPYGLCLPLDMRAIQRSSALTFTMNHTAQRRGELAIRPKIGGWPWSAPVMLFWRLIRIGSLLWRASSTRAQVTTGGAAISRVPQILLCVYAFR